MESTQPSTAARAGRPGTCYTVEEVSQLVGMSPRNIRAHQSRKLLPSPVRRGRNCYYDETHVLRLHHIVKLQRQGFNLVSIAAFLGVGAHDDDEEALLAAAVKRTVRDQPAVFYALNRHGMLGREPDGTATISQPGVHRAMTELVRTGVPPTAALRCLARSLDRIAGVAEELIASSSAELIAAAEGGGPARAADARVPDQGAAGVREGVLRPTRFTEGLVEVLVSTFRSAVEDRGRDLVTELLMEDGGSEPWFEEHLVVENG
ncbi:MerR family transcriptional regulator [Kitasatospora sp. NPDC088391]|uniref:MerR family transcriptional regulator n=1 Tax=Kitasatospora sp. NPDC088391 TaxID=3364074 RepID=UPI003812E4B8